MVDTTKTRQKLVFWLANPVIANWKVKSEFEKKANGIAPNLYEKKFYQKLGKTKHYYFSDAEIEILEEIKEEVLISLKNRNFNFINQSQFVKLFLIPELIRSGYKLSVTYENIFTKYKYRANLFNGEIEIAYEIMLNSLDFYHSNLC